jgi:3-dehydroquinate synthase
MQTRATVRFSGGAPTVTYDYILGDNVWQDLPQHLASLVHDQVFIITDSNLYRSYYAKLASLEKALQCSPILVVPAGESMKRLSIAETIMSRLLDRGASERSLLIGLGGGCVGNLVTFVAGTYYRGIRHVQAPTTLMAMADSAIGHKGAVNIGTTKNACGVFHPPAFIYTDILFLASLPDRHLRNGLAEIVKHGVIEDNSLLSQVAESRFSLAGSTPAFLRQLLQDTLASRMRLSSHDIQETREGALLQCGHVIGRAIELLCPDLLHGEAVAIGLVQEARLGLAAGFPLHSNLPEKLSDLLERCGLPTCLPDGLDRDSLLAQLARDRRHSAAGGARFVFLEDFGCPHKHNGDYWSTVDGETIRAWTKTAFASMS